MDIKLELGDSMIDTTLLCRGCLVSSVEMKNMSEWGLSEDFYKTTNIQVRDTDGLSSLLCQRCEETLALCRRWVAQCRESDCYLRNTAKKKLEDTAPPTRDETHRVNTTSSLLFENSLLITIEAPVVDTKIPLPCPNCQELFSKKSDLHQHLTKTHQMDPTFSIVLQYHCSVGSCPYSMKSDKAKYFTARKFLNQHVNKAHGTKIHCDICKISFSTQSDFNRHLKTCNVTYECSVCRVQYKTNEKLLVHLLRRHPELHRQYKDERRAEKRRAKTLSEPKRSKTEDKFDYMICDSPKRSFATQTLDNIKNDVSLSSWTKRDEISTQTVFEDLLSLKSNEEESIFFSETVSLSDIQTQTFPLEFGLSRSNKETITCETQSPDLSLKGTQTCPCLYVSPRFLDSVTSSPGNLTSTETQTAECVSDLMSVSSIETQTSFDELKGL